jgi:outer membrane protein TolC
LHRNIGRLWPRAQVKRRGKQHLGKLDWVAGASDVSHFTFCSGALYLSGSGFEAAMKDDKSQKPKPADNRNFNSGRRSRCLAAASTLAIFMSLTGCAWLEQQPEVNPDRFAPRSAIRPWVASPAQQSDYAVPKTSMTTPQVQLTDAKTYGLPELIDLALRNNPSTRQAWASARAAAAAFGSSKAPYYPMVTYDSNVGYDKFQFQDEYNEIVIKQWQFNPTLQLTYTLLDFGRRSAAADSARQQLAAANFAFNRKIQDVVFATQRAFYALSASKAAVEAARKNVELAEADDQAVDQRLQLGLATEPALLLSRQRSAQAAYDLETAKVLVRDAQADLAVAVGLAANSNLNVESLEHQPLPHTLSATVDQLIDVALKQRPDLAAQVAALRERDAQLRGTKSAWYPTIGVSANYGENMWWYNWNSFPEVNTRIPEYAGLLTMQWDIFTGLRRLNDIRQAQAQREAAEDAVKSSEVDTIAQVWRAYFQFRSALRKYDYAQAILAASRDAYESNLEAYHQGLSTIVELLSAGNDLASARYTLIQSKADLLTASAAVAYAAGSLELAQTPSKRD